MNKKILITGITGFAGSFLAEYILSKDSNASIVGTYILEKSLRNIASIQQKLQLEKVDLTQFAQVEVLIKKHQPEIVYHLAAIATVGEGFKQPALVIANNATAQINILESLRSQMLTDTKVIVISSAHVYGKVKPGDLPIDEETPLRPDSPYAVSKVTQDFIGLQYFLAYTLPVIRLRPFNHLGPRLNPAISISYFCQEIAKIEKGQQEPVIKVGNLDARRDFTDVHDMVQAYTLAAEKGVSGDVYNIGSGTSYRIGDMLDKLLAMAKVKIEIKQDPGQLRPSDIPELLCDASKFNKLTGWKPTIVIDITLKEMLEYWRNEVSR